MRLSTTELKALGDRFPALTRLTLGRARRKVPFVRQLAATDCGAAALAMALGYHGRRVEVRDVAGHLGPGRGGASAASIIRTADHFGLRGRAVRLEIADLASLPPATVLFWEFRHFVVLDRLRGTKVDIVDPSCGRRTLTIGAFQRAFTGVAITFETTSNLQPSVNKKRRLATLFRSLLEQKGLFIRVITTSAVTQVLSLAPPVITALLIDRIIPRRDYSLLAVLAGGFCAVQLFNLVGGFVRSHLMIHLRTRLEAQFTLRFLDHLIDLPYSYFQNHSTGDLMVRLSSNNSIRDVLTSTSLSAFLDATMASLYLALLLFANSTLTLMVLVLAASRLGLLAVFRARQRQFLNEGIENQARSQTAQVELLAGMETLKAMGIEHRAAENWSNIFVDGLNISIRRGRLDAGFNGILALLGIVSSLCLLFYGAFLVLNGTLTLGTMMAFNALAGGFLTPLNSLMSSALQLQMLEVYVDRLNDVFDTPRECSTISEQPVALTGEVVIENLSFRYGPEEPLVLQEVSFALRAGSRVALVGRTGSGKSTLARLLAGLYEPVSGSLSYDGRSLKHLDKRSVRSQLGIVTQETQLFSGSVRKNIALSDSTMGLDRVIRAAKMACIHEDIMSMPMGYDTPLTDRGLSLSGGQRQRLAIARAIASDPKLLILDEATSHLDSITEETVNRHLASLRCTRIVIAHRLSTIRDADLIVVIEGGRIVELGNHGDLLAKAGKYFELLTLQREAATAMPVSA